MSRRGWGVLFVASDEDAELREALRAIAAAVEKLDDSAAADLTEGLIEEFAGPRRRSVIANLWSGLKAAAPVVGSLTGAAGVIAKFAGL